MQLSLVRVWSTLMNFTNTDLNSEFQNIRQWWNDHDSGVRAFTSPSFTNATFAQGGIVPTGSMIPFAGTVAPSGWLACDGSAVSRTTYAALFAVIGTTWGAGNGTTTFNLPASARNTFVGSGGAGTGTLGNAVGNTGGEETHTLSAGEIPAHQHLYGKSSPSISVDNTGSTRVAIFTADGTGSLTTAIGGSGAHNNIQPSAIVLYIIRT